MNVFMCLRGWYLLKIITGSCEKHALLVDDSINGGIISV